MVRLVPDASVTLTWCFEDEAMPWTDALLEPPGELQSRTRAVFVIATLLPSGSGAKRLRRRGRVASYQNFGIRKPVCRQCSLKASPNCAASMDSSFLAFIQ